MFKCFCVAPRAPSFPFSTRKWNPVSLHFGDGRRRFARITSKRGCIRKSLRTPCVFFARVSRAMCGDIIFKSVTLITSPTSLPKKNSAHTEAMYQQSWDYFPCLYPSCPPTTRPLPHGYKLEDRRRARMESIRPQVSAAAPARMICDSPHRAKSNETEGDSKDDPPIVANSSDTQGCMHTDLCRWRSPSISLPQGEASRAVSSGATTAMPHGRGHFPRRPPSSPLTSFSPFFLARALGSPVFRCQCTSSPPLRRCQIGRWG